LKKKVAILLTTYNGDKYLDEFLVSLIKNQTYKDFTLIVRDDGSTDSTLQIINKYSTLSDKIQILKSSGNIGPRSSFAEILERILDNCDFDYFMFADQDDVWLPDKIEKTLLQMMSLEEKNSNKPLLVHTDLAVVDGDLNLLSKSFWEFQKIDPSKDSLNRILVQNVITGCTVIINRTLANLCVPIPKEAIMHDWWIGLVASVFGKIYYFNVSTILYRQHGYNNLGAKKFNLSYIISKIFDDLSLKKNINQAKVFLKIYQNKLNKEQKDIILAFISLENQHGLQRIITIIKHKFFKNGIIRNFGMLLKAKSK
jgi:glycosyltransferase involved in cell wall biosynthesis